MLRKHYTETELDAALDEGECSNDELDLEPKPANGLLSTDETGHRDLRSLNADGEFGVVGTMGQQAILSAGGAGEGLTDDDNPRTHYMLMIVCFLLVITFPIAMWVLWREHWRPTWQKVSVTVLILIVYAIFILSYAGIIH
jgi:hypothetical protein